MLDDGRRRHLPDRRQGAHRRHAGRRVDAQVPQLAEAGRLPRPGPLDHHRHLPPGRQHEAAAYGSPFPAGDLQHRQHFVERQPERLEDRAVRLHPQLFHPGRHPAPGAGHFRQRFETPHQVLRKPLQGRRLGPGEQNPARPAAGCPEVRAALAAPPALPVFARPQHFQPLAPLRRRLGCPAHARRVQFGRPFLLVDQLGGDGGTPLVHFRVHDVHAVQRHDGFLYFGNAGAQRGDRGPALGRAGDQLHFVGNARLGSAAAEHNGHGDHAGEDGRHHHRQQRRRTAQRGGEDAGEQNAHRRRRTPAKRLALGALCRHPAAGGRRGKTIGEHRHQAHGHHQRRAERQQDGEGEDFGDGALRRAEVHQGDRQQHDGRRQARGGDCPHRAPQPRAHRRRRFHAPLQAAQHGLVDDHAVVDEEPHRERHAGQRQQVQRLAGQIQQREGAEQAHRHGQADHRHGAPIAQEQEQHQQGDGEAREAQPGQAPELLFDEFRGVVADLQFQPQRGDFLAQRRHLLAHGLA